MSKFSKSLGGALATLALAVVVSIAPNQALADDFVRGDIGGDGAINIADVIECLVFLSGQSDLPCLDAADINDDGEVNIADPIVLLADLFTAGSPPIPPPSSCGDDPTADLTSCDSYVACP